MRVGSFARACRDLRTSSAPRPCTAETRSTCSKTRRRLDSRISSPFGTGGWPSPPFGFLRGAAAVMALDLSSTPATGLHVQACGDAHIRNFGHFATPERNLAFSINDFDETLPAPWEWDVKRLAASLHLVARVHGFSPHVCGQIVTRAVRAYREDIARYATMGALELWYDRTDVDDVIEHFPEQYRPRVRRDMRKAVRRDQVGRSPS